MMLECLNQEISKTLESLVNLVKFALNGSSQPTYDGAQLWLQDP